MTLRLQGIGRNFGSEWAVRDVDAVVEARTSVAVLGANGAGKSTLLRLIAGWLPLAAGRITIEGHTLRASSVSVRRRVMLLDQPRAHEGSDVETISQVISDYDADRHGIESEVADWYEKLDLVGIYGKPARAISKGQRYKVAMIGLFLVRPYLWLLDEPFSAGLDAALDTRGDEGRHNQPEKTQELVACLDIDGQGQHHRHQAEPGNEKRDDLFPGPAHLLGTVGQKAARE